MIGLNSEIVHWNFLLCVYWETMSRTKWASCNFWWMVTNEVSHHGSALLSDRQGETFPNKNVLIGVLQKENVTVVVCQTKLRASPTEEFIRSSVDPSQFTGNSIKSAYH